jgi:hypothetical protein
VARSLRSSGLPREPGRTHNAHPGKHGHRTNAVVIRAIWNDRSGARRLGVVTEPSQKVIDSIHSSDGMYCVDVVRTSDRFSLQTCRRDEGRWQVIARPGHHRAREDAVAAARVIIATFE